MKVQTVSGSIDPEKMGRTLMHEHFVFGYPGYEGDRTIAPFRKEEYLAKSHKVIEAVKNQGFSTIIDVTPNDCGRNPMFLREIAQTNGCNIICATGYYYEGEGAGQYFKFRSLFSDIVQEMAQLFIEEIERGIGDTGIKAGVIKVGTSEGVITEYEKAVIKAAVLAQKETGAPIITHTQAGTMGPEQASLLIKEGANPNKTIIGHMCGNAKDLDYQKKTLDQGVGVAFDRIGTNKLFSDITDDDRIDALVCLIRDGYVKRLYLSHDTVNAWLGRDVSGFYEIEGTRYWNMTRIGDYILPRLKAKGINEEEIDQMLVGNIRDLWL